MPRASTLKNMQNPKILVYGKAGCGKTSLFRTIPGRKFLYMFDPAGLNSIHPGDDIEFESFLVDVVPMSVNTLKGSKDSQSPEYAKMETYLRWETDFEKRLSSNFFTDPTVEMSDSEGNMVKGGFDVIGFDSLTTLTDIVMDRVLQVNQRAGKNPELGDYGILANTLARIIRNAAATNCMLFLTAHEEATQDKLLRTISHEIMVPGKLRIKLPLLFSEIYHAVASMDKNGKPMFQIATVPDENFGLARCSDSLRDAGMPYVLDCTIKDRQNPEASGLGPIIKRLRA